MLRVSIIDCAVNQASHQCFNRLVDLLSYKFHYHHPPSQGLASLFKDEADAYIIFGSASNIKDRLEWQLELSKFAYQKLEQDIPILGICFAHQLIGNKMQLAVVKNPDQEDLYGVRTIKIQQSKWGLQAGESYNLFAAHSYCLERSNSLEEVELLASSNKCEMDIISHSRLPFLGVQCHPEASDAFIHSEIEKKIGPLNIEEKKVAKRDGLKLISKFLKNCEKTKHI